MPLFLTKRNGQLTELMDNPDCDKELLFNTYRQFSTLNKLISGWRGLYKSLIRPAIRKHSDNFSLLDIGCGGGDLLRFLDLLAKKDGFEGSFVGIDPDPHALEFISKQQWPANITFHQTTAAELLKTGQTFDIVISNHLVHHLNREQLAGLCEEAERLASQKVIFNDIERSDLGYILFLSSASLIFHKSFIVPDGLTSIKRSYRKQELQAALPAGWSVHRKFPYRLIAIYDIQPS